MSHPTPLLDAFRAMGLSQRSVTLTATTSGLSVEQEAPRGINMALSLFIVGVALPGFMLIDLKVIGIPFGVTPQYVFGPLLILFWLTRDRQLYEAPANPLARIIVLYVVATFLSVFLSYSIPPNAADFADKKPYLFSFTQSLYVCWTLLAALTLCQVFSTFPSLRVRALRVHIFAVCVVSFWGIYQWLAYFFDWDYWTFFNNNPYRSELYEQTFMGLKRVSSLLHEPSDLGLYLLTAIPLLILPLQGKERIVSEPVRIFALAVSTTTLFLSTSFSAYVTFVFFLFVLLTSSRIRKNRRLLLTITAVVILAFGAAAAFFASAGGQYGLQEAMVERAASASSNPDDSTLGRFSAAVAGIRMFIDHPLVGVGEGNSGFHYDEYTSVWSPDALPRINSLLPRMLAEHGLVGGGLFFLLLYRIFQPRQKTNPDSSDFRFVLKMAVVTCFFNLFTSCFDMERFHVWLVTAIFFAVNNDSPAGLEPAVAGGATTPNAPNHGLFAPVHVSYGRS